VPELIPNLVIALGISPPNGILRQAFSWALHWYRVVADVVCCGMGGASAKLKSAQQSVFDSEFATMSPAARPSFADATTIAAGGGPSPGVLVAGQAHHLQPNGLVPVSASSAPIAIPVRRPVAGSASSGNLRAKDMIPAGQDADSTVSPVHIQAADDSAGSGTGTATAASSITSGSTGAPLQAFQVETPGAPGGDSPRSLRFSKGSLVGFVGSIIARSTNSASLGSSSTRGARDRRSSRLRGPSLWGAEGEEDEEWVRQRRDSAEMADMLYRIQSFSTSDFSSAPHSLATSLTSSAAGSRTHSGAVSSHGSVDSNTINNSRRHYITDIAGGNRSLSPQQAASAGRKTYLGGWFS
jgi:hypothetical protein